jgi:hypothetical protein
MPAVAPYKRTSRTAQSAVAPESFTSSPAMSRARSASGSSAGTDRRAALSADASGRNIRRSGAYYVQSVLGRIRRERAPHGGRHEKGPDPPR